jgi:hypothetical protein
VLLGSGLVLRSVFFTLLFSFPFNFSAKAFHSPVDRFSVFDVNRSYFIEQGALAGGLLLVSVVGLAWPCLSKT